MRTPQESANFQALDTCHQQILEHLDRLETLISHMAAQGLDASARKQAAVVERFFSTTSRAHHAEEESLVFPPLLAGGDAALAEAVRSLQQDHGWIEENWLELAPQLQSIAAGNGWMDAAEFAHYVEVFLALCREHIALEESLVYPQSKATWSKALAARDARRARRTSP